MHRQNAVFAQMMDFLWTPIYFPEAIPMFLIPLLPVSFQRPMLLLAATVAGAAEKEAYKPKSSSRSVGAMVLGDLCAELENFGKIGDKTFIAQGMAQFETALAQVEAEIAALPGER